MNIFVIIISFLYRIRWWLTLGTLGVTLWVAYLTRDMTKVYEVNTTVYTGIVSGYDIQSSSAETAINQTGANNAMDNLLNILVSKATLNRVAMRLFAQHMMYGNPNENNKYIQASSFRYVYASVPQDVRDLIDKSSEEITLRNLYQYQEESYVNSTYEKNYVYGLFNWSHPYYSYETLKNIMVRRVGNSDMIDISFQSADPGIAYNTLIILTEEFENQYAELRYGETDNVIKYFEDELSQARYKLNAAEDSLTIYSQQKRVINYEEQSKHVAALSRDFELTYEAILLKHESAKTQIEMLGDRINEYETRAKHSADFLQSTEKISKLSAEKANLDIFGGKAPEDKAKLQRLTELLDAEEKKLMEFSKNFGAAQYTSEGISNLSFIEQWLQAKIEYAKSTAELGVMNQRKNELDDKYTFYSPVGTTIKRKEREISFTESSYITILNGLANAKLRKKNLQLTGASLQVINPPIFPLISKPTKRKFYVAGSFVGSFAFILGIFLLIELLDRTLRDKRRAESVIGLKVIGATPLPSRFKYRIYNKQCEEMADKYLANSLLNFDRVNRKLIVNILSVNENGEKEKLAQRLYTHWLQSELNVKLAICGEDFFVESKEYMFAKDVSDIIDIEDIDIIITVLPALNKAAVPQSIISGASVNLLIANAHSVWQEADQLLVDNFISRACGIPVKLCLVMASRLSVEAFTGLLPPYTFIRKFVYKILQLGITSK
ncbi:MAG: exopolysaccharide biosynthesis protein [Bacteroidales bacterium]